MENQSERDRIARADVLSAQREALVKKITETEIDIVTLERSNPDLVVGRKAKAFHPQTGEPVSFAEVTAREMLEQKRKDKEGFEQRFAAVRILMEREV